jgi:hypothetical protein
VFDAFTQCLQAKCSTSCTLLGGGGGAACGQEGGAGPSDASPALDATPGGGGDCTSCVLTNCSNEYTACEADK